MQDFEVYMMKRKWRATIFIALVLSAICINAFSQQHKQEYIRLREDTLSSIPEHLRERLIERLNLYIKSENQKRLGDIYDLMPDDCRHGLSREEWLSQASIHTPGEIQELLVKEAEIGDYDAPKIWDGERWVVYGCAKYRKEQEILSYKKYYDLLLQSGEWYICRGGIVVEGPDNDYVRCSD